MRYRFARQVAAILAALPLLTAEPIAARTIFPPIGNVKGDAWDEHCPQDKFLIGLRVSYDENIISRAEIVCSAMNAAGRTGRLWYGPAHGHAYDAMQEFGCPRDAVWVGLNAQSTTAGAVRNGISHVNRVWGLCRSRATGARTVIVLGDRPLTAQPAGPDSNYPQRCPNGETGSGLNGRNAGSLLMAIGLDCAVRLQS